MPESGDRWAKKQDLAFFQSRAYSLEEEEGDLSSTSSAVGPLAAAHSKVHFALQEVSARLSTSLALVDCFRAQTSGATGGLQPSASCSLLANLYERVPSLGQRAHTLDCQGRRAHTLDYQGRRGGDGSSFLK